jgi:hypothetical protein
MMQSAASCKHQASKLKRSVKKGLETETLHSTTDRTCPSSSRNPEPCSPKKLRRKTSTTQLPVFTAEPSYRDLRTEDSIVLSIADKFLCSAVGASFLDFPGNDSSGVGHDSTQISEIDTSFTKRPLIKSSF